MEEKHIAKIVQYWNHRANLEKEICQLKAKYYYIEELTDSEEDEWGYKQTNMGYKKANRRIDEKIEVLEERIKKLDIAYEKWLWDKLGLELNDREQDEFTYNLLNNGIKIKV